MREHRELIRKSYYKFLEPVYSKLLTYVEVGSGHTECPHDTVDNAPLRLSKSVRNGSTPNCTWREAIFSSSVSANAESAEATFARAIEVARSQQTRTFEFMRRSHSQDFIRKPDEFWPLRWCLSHGRVGFGEGPELPEDGEANRLLASIDRHSEAVE
jgi:hypothetical protein